MFNPTEHLIDAFVDRLLQAYGRTYSILEPDYPGIIAWAGRMALENIANSDALYHNIEHTMLVTLVGQEILKGKHLRVGGVSPYDWLHFILSLLYHDIGYIRGVCQGDGEGTYMEGTNDRMIVLPPGSTDASLAPYHVDRGKLFIQERFGDHPAINAEIIAANIEHTRFPIPNDPEHQSTADYPGLVRAADLIGQLADPHYLRKLPALFYEFEEIGMNAKLGYRSPSELRKDYPSFFWHMVTPYIRDGLQHLSVTQEGNQWIANLYAHVFTVEHHQAWVGDILKIPL
jgi:hypothetical protein